MVLKSRRTMAAHSTQQHSNKPQHPRGALVATTSTPAASVSRESSAYSFESYLAISSLAICALEAAKDSDMEDLIAAVVAEGGACG